jgi:hypothetical protein
MSAAALVAGPRYEAADPIALGDEGVGGLLCRMSWTLGAIRRREPAGDCIAFDLFIAEAAAAGGLELGDGLRAWPSAFVGAAELAAGGGRHRLAVLLSPVCCIAADEDIPGCVRACVANSRHAELVGERSALFPMAGLEPSCQPLLVGEEEEDAAARGVLSMVCKFVARSFRHGVSPAVEAAARSLVPASEIGLGLVRLALMRRHGLIAPAARASALS